MTNIRTLSNTRNIELEKLKEDEMIVEAHLELTKTLEARIALVKLLGLIKSLKANV